MTSPENQPRRRARHVYIISDLHLGGRWPAPVSQPAQTAQTDIGGERGKDPGFRMMTRPDALARFIRAVAAKPSDPGAPRIELLINGDFVDFLAEEHDRPRWVPFMSDPDEAVRVFERLAARQGDAAVFDALGELLDRGHALTVLLGNHDLELSLPQVRRAFEERIGAGPESALRFLYDGEALEIGTAVIEHGNRYDPANMVNHDQLGLVRSLLSRRQVARAARRFIPPIGSVLVAEIMNPIKTEYQFIDLLKPESEPLIALLLALEPKLRDKLVDLAKLLQIGRNDFTRLLGGPTRSASRSPVRGDISSQAQTHRDGGFSYDGGAGFDSGGGFERGGGFEDGGGFDDSGGGYGGEMGASYGTDISSADDPLASVLSAAMPVDAARALAADADAVQDDDALAYGDISSTRGLRAKLGVAGLLISGKLATVKQRLGLVQHALRAVDGDRSFDDGHEASKRYLDAATELGRHYRFVVFGHTHLAKDIALPGGARYLNTGTWANLMRFPDALFDRNIERAGHALESFFHDIRKNRLASYVEFRPTFVRLRVTPEGDTDGALLTYDPDKGEVD